MGGGGPWERSGCEEGEGGVYKVRARVRVEVTGHRLENSRLAPIHPISAWIIVRKAIYAIFVFVGSPSHTNVCSI
jgi:hypothetical protein